MPRGHRTRRVFTRCTPALVIATGALASIAQAETQPGSVTLQWFEAEWSTIETKMPDFFVAGYSSTWLPPISLASNESPGYDPFERFHIGVPGEETFYGTFRDFRAMVDEFHRASSEVYVDTILNHNGGRTGNQFFHEAGGWPGFWSNWTGGTKFTGGDWGDFNNGTTQSENPGAGNYDLWRGDLVGLVDIDYTSNNWMVRHPIDSALPEGIQGSPTDPATRIPEGTFRNQPDPANARWYPDLALAPTVVNNPGIFRPSTEGFPSFNIPAESTTIYPFNIATGEGFESATAGDPVPENAVALLSRWSQWALEVLKIDGFRLDALKHSEPFYWDQYWDVAVHDRRRLFDGSTGTPFSFGESTASDNFIINYYIRKDGFGNRDSLDLSGAGTIRNIINGRGLGNLAQLDDQGLDISDDGFNNGSLGMLHSYSHDNGTRGDGGSTPLWPYEDKMAPWAHAYLLLRTGRAIVYHNARGNVPNVNRFWPRQGIPTALGVGEFYTIPAQVPDGDQPPTTLDNRFVKLVQLRNQYGRGNYLPRFESSDTFVFERQGNMIVGLRDVYSNPVAGVYWQEVTVNSDITPGTVLVEVTGNAGDARVDPSNQLFTNVTVQPNGNVTFRIPNNISTAGEHSSGYVAYAPQTPRGTLSIGNASDTLLPDSASTPSAIRRITPIKVVTGPTFSIDLTTIPNDFDSQHDDNAAFRINAGYADYNNDGQMSRDEFGAGQFEQYENFLTTKQPLFGTANPNGLYSQTVDADDLPEGRNYVSTIAFRQRPGGDALLTDFRTVIYIDRQDPDITVEDSFDCGLSSGQLTITNDDRTVTDVRVYPGFGPGDTLPAPVQANVAQNTDRGVFSFNITSITEPTLDVAIQALEAPGALQSGSPAIRTVVEYRSYITGAKGDVDLDGRIDAEDLYALEELLAFECRADLDSDDDVDGADADELYERLRTGEVSDVLANR